MLFRSLHRAVERAEDYAAALDAIGRYDFETARIRQDLALRPPAAQVEARREALVEQVTKLSQEHARLSDDLDLVTRSADGREMLAARCDGLRERLRHVEAVLLPDAERQAQQLRSANFDAKCTVAQWQEDEAPRHVAFENRLDHERRGLQLRLDERRAATDAALAGRMRRRNELIASVRQLRGRLRAAGGTLPPQGTQPHGDPHEGGGTRAVTIDGDDSAADRGGWEAGRAAEGSPADGSVVVEVHQLEAEGGAPADGAAAASQHHTVVTRERVPAPPRPVLYAVGDRHDRHFNFIAVSVVKSVLSLFRRGRRRLPILAQQRGPQMSV